jgi:hypothetical protein
VEFVNNLVNKVTGWIDNLFNSFGFYTQGYSQYLVYGLLIFLLSKMLKVKLDVNVGKKK